MGVDVALILHMRMSRARIWIAASSLTTPAANKYWTHLSSSLTWSLLLSTSDPAPLTYCSRLSSRCPSLQPAYAMSSLANHPHFSNYLNPGWQLLLPSPRGIEARHRPIQGPSRGIYRSIA